MEARGLYLRSHPEFSQQHHQPEPHSGSARRILWRDLPFRLSGDPFLTRVGALTPDGNNHGEDWNPDSANRDDRLTKRPRQTCRSPPPSRAFPNRTTSRAGSISSGNSGIRHDLAIDLDGLLRKLAAGLGSAGRESELERQLSKRESAALPQGTTGLPGRHRRYALLLDPRPSLSAETLSAQFLFSFLKRLAGSVEVGGNHLGKVLLHRPSDARVPRRHLP